MNRLNILTVQPGMAGKLLYQSLAGNWFTDAGIKHLYCTCFVIDRGGKDGVENR